MDTEVVRQPTYQDVLDAPENMVAEILAGVLHLTPRPAGLHTRAAGKLYSTIEQAFDRGKSGPGGWIILGQPEIHLHGDVIVPDIAGWRLATTDHFALDVPYFEIRPDWICEVLSPSTEKFDRTVKLHIYARERVQHAWFVNPVSRTLEVMRLDANRWTIVETFQDEQPVRIEPFDAIEFELTELWAKIRP